MINSLLSRIVLLVAISLLHLGAIPANAESVSLDGVDDHIAIGSDGGLATPTFTVETWFKRAEGGTIVLVNTTNSYPLISRGNAANYFLGIASDGRLHGQVKTPGNSRYSIFSTVIPVGEWHHGALTYDGATLRLYLDGVLASSSILGISVDTAIAGTRLGQVIYQGVTYGAYLGLMDEVRIWKTARTQPDILANMAVPLEFAPNLLARWGFDGTTNTTVTSSGLNEIAATLSNGAAYVASTPSITNTQPTASITAPVGPINANNSATIAFSAVASDPDDAIVRVEYHDQFSKLGQATVAPYTFEWNPTIGNHVVRAVAVDAAGHVNGAMPGVLASITPTAGSEAIYLSETQNMGGIASATLTTYTVETWFRIEGNGTPYSYGLAGTAIGDVCAFVFRGTTPTSGNYLLGFRPTDDRLVGGFVNGTNSFVAGNSTIARGVWNHAAVTYDGFTVRLYLNGVLDGAIRNFNTLPANAASTFVGGFASQTGRFHGQLDEVRVWNYARPPAAIMGARLLRDITDAALPIYFRMNEGLGSVIANSGTAGGSLTFPTIPAAIVWTPSAPWQAGSAPSIVLTSPESGTIGQGSVLAVSASASDSDGSIARVEFWDGATKLGESLASPYAMDWTANRTGLRRVTAVAIDNDGFAGTVTPAAVTVSPATGSTGIGLDGSDDRASGIGTALAFTNYTVEAWFRRDDFGRAYYYDGINFVEPIMANQTFGGSSHGLNFLIGIRQRDGVLVGMTGAALSSTTIAGSTAIGFGEWHHAALSHSGSLMSLYLDGTLIAQAAAATPLTASMTLSVGGHQTAGLSGLLGAVDDVRVWNFARTSAEIAADRNMDVPSSHGLVARWAFSEGTGTTANSTAGGSFPLALTGGAVWTQGVTPIVNALPVVSITSPAASAAFPLFSQITVSCTANDPDGSIARVKLYNDGVKVAEVTSAPFDIPFTVSSLGSCVLRAVAYDNAGAAATSADVSYFGTAPVGGDGLFFDGADDLVATPAVAAAGFPRFTVETWFRREGNGLSTNFGSIPVFPLFARGSTSDSFNFLLGINSATGVLVGGFHGLGGLTITASGTATIPSSEWHHAAMSFDGGMLRLFLDGQQIASTATTATPRTDALFRVAFGATITNSGSRVGAFRGFLDEPRIWDHARTAAAIDADRWSTAFAGTGPAARWALSEGSGVATSSSGSVVGLAGTLTGGAQWTVGRPAPSASVPSITLSAPGTGVVGTPFLLNASPSSAEAISKVEFFAGESKLGEVTSEPWEWSFTATADGNVVFSSIVTTATGQKAASNEVLFVFTSAGGGGVYFDGNDDFVQLPASAELSASTFTWEFWFRPSGPGLANGGTLPVVPLISRGATGSTAERVDYVVGISSTRKLVSFFSTSTAATGSVTLADNTWYHCAVSLKNSTLKIYVNGVLDAALTTTIPAGLAVASPSFGTMIDSAGVSRGAFLGAMDEIRLWSTERSVAEIAANMNREIHGAPGLVSRWGFVESDRTAVADSGAFALHGSLRNGATHTAGVALVTDSPPVIALVSPPSEAASIFAPTQLEVNVGGGAGESLTPVFYGRELPRALSDFTVVVISDTGNYTASQNGGTPATLDAMMDWVVAERPNRNIVFVTQTGSLILGANANLEMQAASSAFTRLENPATTGSPWGIPFGVAFGDTDNLGEYDLAFGPSRVVGKPWFAGSQAVASNGNHAEFFNAGGAGYGVIHLAHNASLSASSPAVLWAKALLAKNRDRQFIVVFHDIVGATSSNPFTPAGSILYTAIRSEVNVILLLGGNPAGEFRRTESFGGRTYHALSANFSDRPNGGDGWLRLMEFSPSTGRIHVRTYSPTLAQHESDANSDFTLRWTPQTTPAAWGVVASNPPQESGPSLAQWATASGHRYEWFATVADATNTIGTGTQRFSTSIPPGAQPPSIVLNSPDQPTNLTLPCVAILGAIASSADDEIESVEFFADGFRIASDTAAPYSAIWQPGGSGTFQITAVATDRSGLQATSGAVPVTIAPNTGDPVPTISITNPVAGNLPDPGTVTITANASVVGGTIASVQFLINDGPLSTVSAAPFNTPWTPAYGNYSLRAVATSSTGTSAMSGAIDVAVIPFTPTVTRQPYLQLPAPTAITVRWRTTESHVGRIYYGAAPGALTSFVDESIARTNHEIRITGLQPNTRYYYGVGAPALIVSGNDARTFFHTAPLAGLSKPTRIWALGDAGFGNAGQISTREAYYANVGTRHTDILLMLGDNAYNSGFDSEYQSRFFNTYEPLIRKSHVWSTIGNHETFAGSPYPYYDIFSFPTGAESGGVASGTEAFYSFDHGNIHFICLDSMVSDRSPAGPMATWLASDISSTNARWIIGFFHHPPYTRGGYNSDTMTESIAMRANLLPILEQYGVDVVLSGHDHNYERTWLISGNYGASSTFNSATMKKNPGFGRPLTDGPYVKNVNVSESNKGAVYIVAGSAASLYSAPTAHPAIAVGLNLLGTAILDIDGNRLDMSFLKSDGTMGDSFTMVKPYGTIDSDGDGMPDDYENERGFAPASALDGAADTDGDGRTNRDEFAAGTNPFDAASFLSSSLQAVAGGFNFRFNTVPGYRYTVETKDALAEADWMPMPAATNLRGTGGERTIADATAEASRFYRVKAIAE